MSTKIFFLFIAAFLFAALHLSAQTGNEKKSGDVGTSMNKQDNRMTVRDTGGSLKGIQVNTLSVEEIIGTAALCKYSVKMKDSSLFSEMGVCWGKSQNPEISGNKTSVSSFTENVSAGEMTGLDPGTKYYVRAYVTAGTGTIYGKEVMFTTPSGTVNSTYWIRRR